jgi:hypothetical protein
MPIGVDHGAFSDMLAEIGRLHHNEMPIGVDHLKGKGRIDKEPIAASQ